MASLTRYVLFRASPLPPHLPPRPCLPQSQSQPICLSVYNTTLLGLVDLAVQLLLASNTAIVVGSSSFTAAVGTVFTVSVLFGPKVYRVSYREVVVRLTPAV